MSAAEDLNCELQIDESNALGNSLLAGLASESIIQSKRSIENAPSLGSLSEAITNYKEEVEKLKLLQIGACSRILDMHKRTNKKELKSMAEDFTEIVDVLKSNVDYNAANVVSKKELDALSEQMVVLKSLKDELQRNIPSDELVKHSQMISDVMDNLQWISTSLGTMEMTINQMENQALLDSAEMFYFSSLNCEAITPF